MMRLLIFLTIAILIQTSSATGWIKVNPFEGTVGSEFLIMGGDFTPNSLVGIFFGERTIDIIKTDINGSFLKKLKVPEIHCGKHGLLVIDETKKNAKILFNVTPAITKLSKVRGAPNTSITITGKGFSANSDVEVRFVNLFEYQGISKEEIIREKIVKTNEKGTFEIKFEIPTVAPGYYLIYAHDPECGLKTEYRKFEVLEPKTTPTPKPQQTQKTKPAESDTQKGEKVEPQKTPKALKASKSTPGFELLIALGGIAIAFLVARRFRQ
ncbi:MAG: hypothetical protein N3D09_01915 [Archaeoglobaceae archaeon]|nr:hypothetical protein [Archaeoglobaceae archaeon]